MGLMRVFSFSPDRLGRGEFRMIYEAFRGLQPDKISKDDRRHAAECQKALELVSEPIGDLPDEADFDVRLRKLAGEGLELRVSQRAYEWLMGVVEASPYQAGLSAQVEALRDRLGAAEKIDSDETASVGAFKARARR